MAKLHAQRAGRWLAERMGQRQMSVAELARRSNVSASIITEIRDGTERPRRQKTLAAISQAVGAHHDALAAIFAGKQPPPDPEPVDVTAVEDVEALRDDLRVLVGRVAVLEAAIERLENALRRAGSLTG